MLLNRSLIIYLLLSVGLQTTAQEKGAQKLWYRKPAQKWTDALPIGNGSLGGMIFGGVQKERIQFNEETLWTGEPRKYSRAGASAYLDTIRQLLFAGKQEDAEKLAEEKFMGLKSNEGRREEWRMNMRALKGLDGNPASSNYNDSKWATIDVPSYEGWETVGLEGLDGAVWFRTTFELPNEWAGKNLVLDLNRIRDEDFTYLNGKLVGTTNTTTGRKYVVPKEVLVAGKNVIAIQVLNYFDKGGIAGYKDTSRTIAIYPEGTDATKGISLVKKWKYKIQNDEPPAVPHYQGDYQPFGDLWLEFKHSNEAVVYKRGLDLTNATASTSYSIHDTTYERSYFVSAPDSALVVRLTSNKKRAISFNASLSSPHKYNTLRKIDAETIAVSLQVRNGALKGVSYLRVVAKGGTTKIINNQLVITGADEAVLYLTAATNYRNYHDVSAKPEAICQSRMRHLKDKSFTTIADAHKKEYQRFFKTFALRLGNNNRDAVPTDERLAQFATVNDPAFAALYVQYARYLLISSSRPGTRPANLQGIWNDLLAPPWGSKYTTNINLEMNYWPAEMLNLSPMSEPLFQMIDELVTTGRQTAKDHYSAPGWVLHHNTDIWRGTAPINASNHGIWVSGGGWLSRHLWEHYLFTQDKAFLQQRAYPVMKEAALFYTKFLVKDPKAGWLISTPSNSPEQGGLVAGPTMDHQIIRSLLKACIEASEVLGTDEAFRKTLKEIYPQIAPNQVGKYGQLQEWLQDIDDPKNNHRHVSHLWGVHPGNEINWVETPDLMKAARQSLLYRGDAGTGWSLAWKINFWARFKEGDHAHRLVTMLLSPAGGSGGSYVNLFDAHPPFQIDGNFGGAAGIGEMLIQSHTGFIDLLPALPSGWADGVVQGLCARGGFEISMRWKNNQVSEVNVLSKAGNECVLRYGTKEIRFPTQKGKTYRFNVDLKQLAIR
jgi:alpha-L-fucosidase 2